MTFLLVAWRALHTKVGMYAALAAAAGIAVLKVLSDVRAGAVSKERLRVASLNKKHVQEAQQLEASIDGMSDADVRSKLHDRWSRPD